MGKIRVLLNSPKVRKKKKEEERIQAANIGIYFKFDN